MKKILLTIIVVLTVFLSCQKKNVEAEIVKKISIEIGDISKQLTGFSEEQIYIWKGFTLPYGNKLKDIVDKELGLLPTKIKGNNFTWETPEYEVLLEQGGILNEDGEVILQAKLFFKWK